MSNINISLAEVSEAASKMRNYNQIMYEDLQNMKKDINSLDISWISDGSTEIRNRFNMLSAKFDEYKNIIESYVNFLELTVSSYDSLETTITSNASGIQY